MSASRPLRTLMDTASRFARTSHGSVATLTGLMFPLLLMFAGGATDLGRAYSARAEAQRTLDATVLSMARSGLSDDEISAEGPRILEEWIAARKIGATLENAQFSSRKDGLDPGVPSEVTGRANLKVKPYFLSIFGQDSIDIGIGASTLKPNPLPYEIALVLDVSGSMNADLNGRPRIERLKEAVGALLGEIESQSANGAPRVSVVPYSSSVNLGDLGTGILEGASVGSLAAPAAGGDVWAAERSRGDDGVRYDLGEESPDTSAIPFVTAPEMAHAAPAARLQAPSDDPAVYRAAVDGLTAQGWTAAHLGMIWGVYTLSPAWKSVWKTDPRPHDKAQKAIVVLTDGEFNTTHNIGARSNADGDESNRYFQSACDLAKRNGTAIYAVALSLDAKSEARLATCAQGSGGAMFSADSAAELTGAFRDIARRIGGLRLSS